MRNHGSGRLRVSMFEDQAFASQAVKGGCTSGFGAHKTHAVGASGIERDQNQIGFRGGACEGAIEEEEKETHPEQDFSNHDCSNHGIECNSCPAPRKATEGASRFRLDVPSS